MRVRIELGVGSVLLVLLAACGGGVTAITDGAVDGARADGMTGDGSSDGSRVDGGGVDGGGVDGGGVDLGDVDGGGVDLGDVDGGGVDGGGVDLGGCTPTTETCNGVDDDCNGTVDDGLGTVTCGVGACAASVMACSGGVTQTCTPGTPGTETCNGVDDDCNGTVDDGLGTLSCGVGACAASVMACIGGVTQTCTPGTPGTETCNGIDDDCNGTADDGLGTITCGTGVCAATVTACIGGVTQTCTPGTPGTETCNGMDDDCDGVVDNGNPGGGVVCAGAGADVGACVSRTACIAGMLICRGTFVAPPGAGGSPTNPGTRTAPLSTIAAAQTNAVTIGGGADVCACATASGAAVYPENVVMVEGVSVLGNYDCTTWTRPGRVTRIDDIDNDGVNFPAGITTATSLEQFTVNGIGISGAAGRSQAITITSSSPQILNVNVNGGAAPTSVGIECQDCAGSMLTSVNSNAGNAATLGLGFHGTGAVGRLSVMSSSFSGGTTNAGISASSGVRLEGCTGVSSWSATNTFGGGITAGGMVVGTRTGFEATGAMCAPTITGGQDVGCEAGGLTCVGISCTTGAQCAISGVLQTAGSLGIRGSTSHVQSCYGLRCNSGGCASIVNNTINACSGLPASTVLMGFEVDGSSPLVDRNTITGPTGGIGVPPMLGRFYGLYLHQTTSQVTNNIILDGSWAGAVDVLRFDMLSLGPALLNPVVHSNTINYTACTGCGARVGLGLAGSPGGVGSPQGIFRNNIFQHSAAGGVTRPVVEYDISADPLTFENNDLYDPNALATPYFDEGTTGISIAMVNALGAGYSANIATTCALTVTYHLPGAASACYDTGTAAGPPPTHDFDNETRPFSVAGGPRYDIGADEFHP